MFDLLRFGVAKLPAANDNKTWYSSSSTGWMKLQLAKSILARTICTKNINEGKMRLSFILILKANYLLSHSRIIHSHNYIKNCLHLTETVSLQKDNQNVWNRCRFRILLAPKKENKALPLKNRVQSWFNFLRSLFCFPLWLWNQSALICETCQNIWNITKTDKNTFLEFICCLEFLLMLLKGFRQKRTGVCDVLTGANFDLQSPTKGHKNQKTKFLSLKGSGFRTLGGTYPLFSIPHIPWIWAYKDIKWIKANLNFPVQVGFYILRKFLL